MESIDDGRRLNDDKLVVSMFSVSKKKVVNNNNRIKGELDNNEAAR